MKLTTLLTILATQEFIIAAATGTVMSNSTTHIGQMGGAVAGVAQSSTIATANSPQDKFVTLPLGASRNGDVITLCQPYEITVREGKNESATHKNTPITQQKFTDLPLPVTREPCEPRLGEVYNLQLSYKNNTYYTYPAALPTAQYTLRVVEESAGAIQVKPRGTPAKYHYLEIKKHRGELTVEEAAREMQNYQQ